MNNRPQTTVVIGGGFAGLAAAIHLQERRHDVVLLERRGVLGGRATSYRDALSGEDVDNGTHLMVAAYEDTLDLLKRAGADDLLLVQDDLRIDYVDDHGRSALVCPRLPAPWHLLAGLVRLRLPWHVRLEALRLGLHVRFGNAGADETLADFFRRTGQSAAARRLVWDPLSTAILNETPERAAAVLFERVYRDAFLSSSRAGRLVFLKCGYGTLHARLARYFESRGGTIRRRTRATSVEVEGGRVTGVRYTQGAQARAEIQRGKPDEPGHVAAGAVVVAVPWGAVAGLLPEEYRGQAPFERLAQLGASPIVSIELWLDRPVVDLVMVGLRDCEVEWVFDKGRLYGRAGAPQHLAFIVSAAERSAPRPNAELVALAAGALRRYFPAMADAKVLRSLVMREAEATFACTPAAECLRPGARTPIAGLFLAGDWTDTRLPATIEGAVRSGLAAARAVGVTARSPDP